MYWIKLARDRDRRRAVVQTVLNLRAPYNRANSLNSWRLYIFWRRTLQTTDWKHTGQDRWIQTELALILAKNATKPNPFEIVSLQTTRKMNIWKAEETLARAVVTLETERIKGSNPWCLWLWWEGLCSMESVSLFVFLSVSWKSSLSAWSYSQEITNLLHRCFVQFIVRRHVVCTSLSLAAHYTCEGHEVLAVWMEIRRMLRHNKELQRPERNGRRGCWRYMRCGAARETWKEVIFS
jgi:hypothetical protein